MISFNLGIRPRRRGGPGGGAAKLTKVLFVGNSIVAATNSFSDLAAADHPKWTVSENAVAGTALNTGANSFMSRQAAMLAVDHEVMVVLAGANDLSDTATYPTVQDWVNQLYAFTDPFRAAGKKVIVIQTLPQGSSYPGGPTNNTRRQSARTILMAAVGSRIEAFVDLNGTTMGTDANANSPTYYDSTANNGLHPTDLGHSLLWLDSIRPVLRTVMGWGVWHPNEFIYSGGSGRNGWIYDPADISTLFQDTGAVTPVSAEGQPCLRINDVSGFGYHMLRIAGSPVYRTNGGAGGTSPYIDIVGAESFQTNSFASKAQPHYDCIGVKLDSLAATVVITDGATGARMAMVAAAPGDLIIQGGAGVDTTLNLTTSPCVIEGLFQGGSSTAFLEGVQGASVNAGANGVTALMWGSGIGPANFVDGQLNRRCGCFGSIPNTRVRGYMRTWVMASQGR